MKMLQMQSVTRRIPLEVYLEILGYFGPPQGYKTALVDLVPDMASERNRTIRNMALVCRDFYGAMFPHLFENVFIYSRHETTPTPCGRFCESIANGDPHARRLAANVKTFVIGGFNLENNSASDLARTRMYSACLKSLQFMSNLAELHLFQSPITNEFLRVVGSLPPLKALHMQGCQIPESLDVSELRRFGSLKATTMYENGTCFYKDFHSIEPTTELLANYLLPQTVHYKSEEPHYRFLNRIALLPPMPHLESVDMDRLNVKPQPRILAEALKAMPMLKSLQIRYFDYLVDEGGIFEPCTTFPSLPMLEQVHASLPVLLAVVPGSRVSSIGIAYESIERMCLTRTVPYDRSREFWIPVAEAFQASSRPIEELDVPMRFYHSIAFHPIFPALKSLVIRPTHKNWFNRENRVDKALYGGQPDEIISTFLTSWVDHPDLTRLTFVYEHDNCPFPVEESATMCDVSDDTLAALKLRIPTLEWLTFIIDPLLIPGEEIFEFYLGDDGNEEAEEMQLDTVAPMPEGEEPA